MSAAPLINTQAEFPGQRSEGRKLPMQDWRYRLRRTAGKCLGATERVYSCGYKAHRSTVDVRRNDKGGLYYAGLETCGSVWHCPVCAGKVAAARCEEVENVIDAHIGVGGAVYMATFTLRHHVFQRCADLREAVSAAWRKLQQGRAWVDFKKSIGFVGSIRALEVTHGENGWHPHLHVLICSKASLSENEQASAGLFLFERWAKAIEKLGFGACSRDAFQFDRCATPSDAGAYVSKWGAASELVKGHSKLGRSGGMSPWQLLREFGGGSKEAAILFREYAKAFKGARQLTWSEGFRARYGFGPEVDDYAVAADESFNSETLLTLPKHIHRQIVFREIEVEVLNAASDGGWQAALVAMRAAGISWDEAEEWFRRPIIPHGEVH